MLNQLLYLCLLCNSFQCYISCKHSIQRRHPLIMFLLHPYEHLLRNLQLGLLLTQDTVDDSRPVRDSHTTEEDGAPIEEVWTQRIFINSVGWYAHAQNGGKTSHAGVDGGAGVSVSSLEGDG